MYLFSILHRLYIVHCIIPYNKQKSYQTRMTRIILEEYHIFDNFFETNFYFRGNWNGR